MSFVSDTSMMHSGALRVQEGTVGVQAFDSTNGRKRKTPLRSIYCASTPSKGEVDVLHSRARVCTHNT